MGSILFSRQFDLEMSSAPGSRAAARELVFRASPVAMAVLTAAAYYAGSRIGFTLTPHNTPIAIFWPANAILLAAFLLSPIRHWWIYSLAVLPAHLLVQRQTGIALTMSLGWYISNTSEALIGAATIHYLSGIRKKFFGFNDTKDLKIFLLGAVLAAPFLTSFMDAATAVRAGYPPGYWTLWGTRLVSNMIANLTLVPAIVTLCREGSSWFKNATPARCLELAWLFLGAALVTIAERMLADFSAVMFAPLPFLLWAALRFGPAGVSSCLLAVALISLSNAIHGLQTSAAASVARNVLTMQVLIAALGIPLIWLSLLIKERRAIERSLSTPHDLLMQAEDALRRIGRKLHRDLTQQLTLLGLEVEDLSGSMESSATLKAHLLTLNDQIAQLLTAARDWSHVLDPVAIEYLGLAGALAALCRHATERSGIKFTLRAEIGGEHLDPVTSLSLYRLVQQAVEDILKLNSARMTNLRLETSGESAHLVLEHDGTGMDDERWQESDIGVVSMSQRVALINGILSVHSSSTSNRIEITVPLRKAKNKSIGS